MIDEKARSTLRMMFLLPGWNLYNVGASTISVLSKEKGLVTTPYRYPQTQEAFGL